MPLATIALVLAIACDSNRTTSRQDGGQDGQAGGGGGGAGNGGSGGSAGTGGGGGAPDAVGDAPKDATKDTTGPDTAPEETPPGMGYCECSGTYYPSGCGACCMFCEPCGSCGAGSFCDRPEKMCADATFGWCRPVPSDCKGWDTTPVCGCDGKTYAGDCERQRAGIQKSHDGAC